MEIINSTTYLDKSKKSLTNYLQNNDLKNLELGFTLTKDGILIYSYSPVLNHKAISSSSYEELPKPLTLTEVLEIINGRNNLFLEIKYFTDLTKLDNLLKSLEILKDYPKKVFISSLNSNLIIELLKLKKELACKKLGLIINKFKSYDYQKNNIKDLKKIDFLSLEALLWKNTSINYNYFKELFPKALIYAWTLEDSKEEESTLVRNYFEQKADGIIVNNFALARRLNKKYN